MCNSWGRHLLLHIQTSTLTPCGHRTAGMTAGMTALVMNPACYDPLRLLPFIPVKLQSALTLYAAHIGGSQLRLPVSLLVLQGH